jgi:pimeloyl-ACP methyl ester carboxylesterase
MGDDFARRRVAGNGIELAVVDEGSGPAVLLLHGWPDSADLWRLQIPALVAGGFRVIAPDMRGFGASDKPSDVRAYRVIESVRDMVALLQALRIDRVDVVGHDWGSPVAWVFATFHAHMTRRLAALSTGHPSAFGATGDDGLPPLEHLQRQWYALLFQFEGVAEQWLSDEDWRRFRAFVGPARDMERYILDLSRPGALQASLNWYRANSPLRALTGGTRPLPLVPEHVNVLGLWADGDRYLIEAQMRESYRHVGGGWRYERVTAAGHWMQLDQPDEVTRLLIEHFAT